MWVARYTHFYKHMANKHMTPLLLKKKHIKPMEKKNKHIKTFGGQIWRCKYRKKHIFYPHKGFIKHTLALIIQFFIFYNYLHFVILKKMFINHEKLIYYVNGSKMNFENYFSLKFNGYFILIAK